MRSRTAFIAALAFLCGCPASRDKGDSVAAVPPPAVPPFYCERTITNYAWSYQHRGVYVDGAGAVFSYRHEREDQRLLRVHPDSLTEQALLARYAPGRTQIGSVAPAELAERYGQVAQARAGELSARTRRGADMGAIVRRCYLPDDAGVYREVLLRQTGDWERRNLSPAAAELSTWLDSIALRARQ